MQNSTECVGSDREVPFNWATASLTAYLNSLADLHVTRDITDILIKPN